MANKIDNLILIKIPNRSDYTYRGSMELEEFILGKEYKIEISNKSDYIFILMREFNPNVALYNLGVLIKYEKLNEYFETRRESNLKQLGI